MKIFILEDNEERRQAMLACLTDRFAQYEARFFVTADTMVSELRGSLNDALLISLDHDLEYPAAENGQRVDPGDGRIVADFLATQTPCCPIVIHSTNTPAAVGMEAVLEEAAWRTYRISPYSDLEWITQSWFPTVRRAIVDHVQLKPQSADQTS